MEKNKNISLDELFARAKGEEPVISQEDVRAIVSSATSPVQSIKTTTSIISRKGFIMTGLGLATAGAALFLSLSGQSPVPSGQGGSGQWSVASGQLGDRESGMGTGEIETPAPTNEPKKEVKVTKKMIIVRDNGDGTELAVDPNVPEPPMPPTLPLLPDGKLMAPVEVERVAIIQVKDEDLAKLDLQKAPNGVLLYKGAMKGGTVMTINIPAKGWGVVTNMQKSDDASNLTKLSPTIITDSRGNKRYMHFADENSMVHMEQYEGDMIDSIAINDEHISSNDQDIIIRKGTVNDTKIVRGKKTITSKVMVSHDSSHVSNGILVIDNEDANNTKGIHVNVDMSNDEELPTDFNFEMKVGDSSLKINELVRDAMSKAKVAMKDMKIGMDTMRNAMVKVKIEKGFLDRHAELDTAMKNLKKQMSSIMVIDQNFTPEESAKLDKGVMIRMPNINGTMKAMEVKITAKLNSLVPVLVRKATDVTHNAEENRDYDNGVIMWFEPEQFWKRYEEVASSYEVVMPRGTTLVDKNGNPVQNVQNTTPSSASVVSNTMVYPNPVRTAKTNIHYKLSEPRSLAFSIHDILGKKIVDCGSLAERPQGEYDFELNIGNIPAGIYLVVITTDKGEQTIQRIAVEK